MGSLRIRQRGDTYECFECNKRTRSIEEIAFCPFCGSDEVDIVV